MQVGPDTVLPPHSRISMWEQKESDGFDDENSSDTETKAEYNSELLGKKGAGFSWTIENNNAFYEISTDYS